MQRKLIISNPDKCLGCQICEFACSARKEKSTDPLVSRIRVVNLEPTGSMAIACSFCENPPCVASCPRNALMRSEKTGVIKVDETRCIGCGWCFASCKLGAIAKDPNKKVAMCDLCDGEPECVKYCPFEGALKFTTLDEVAGGHRRERARALIVEERLSGKS